jgi:SAM-dependent methyltransferase
VRQDRVAAGEVWAEQVRAAYAQIERVREVEEPPDPYGPWARRFAVDPRRTDDEALSLLLTITRPGAVWLDLGAGGGRYALPLALAVRRVIAVEPSTAMLEVLRRGLAEHGIGNVEVVEDSWPTSVPMRADVALAAHVGYDIADFAAFLGAAQAAAPRIVVIMRTSGAARINEVLWPEIHAEPRQPYPMLSELLQLLEARGIRPAVTYVGRGTWAYDARDQLLAAARRLLYLRPGSAKDRALERLVLDRATERQGKWEVDWTPMQDGVVTWESQR